MANPAPKKSPGEARARRNAGRLLGRKLPKTVHCSFCGKSQHQVKMLIAGPGMFICDECVGLCSAIVAGGSLPDRAYFKPLERPTGELLELLPSVNYAADSSRDFLQQIVDT